MQVLAGFDHCLSKKQSQNKTVKMGGRIHDLLNPEADAIYFPTSLLK